MRTLVTLALLGASCGDPSDDFEEPLLDGTELTDTAELGALSPSDRIILWQQNIEGMKAGAVAARYMTDAMLVDTYRPDIVIMQEAWQRVLCGNYMAQDPALYNFANSQRDANGLSKTCSNGSLPMSGSLLRRLGSTLWGGVANVGHRRPFSNTLGSHTATGTAIAWDQRRFVIEDDFVYDDSKVPGCPTTITHYKRIAVLLRDTRRTVEPADDRLIAVASLHYGSACKSSSDRWIAEEMMRRWQTFEGRPLSLRAIGGDFNTRVDEASSTYVARRREETPQTWYTRYTTSNGWLGGKFLDPIKVRHGGGSGDTAGICGQWSYPNVQSCVYKTLCSGTCAGWGIGGKLDRIDFLFLSNRSGNLAASRIISASTDERSAIYSDHKGVRVSIKH